MELIDKSPEGCYPCDGCNDDCYWFYDNYWWWDPFGFSLRNSGTWGPWQEISSFGPSVQIENEEDIFLGETSAAVYVPWVITTMFPGRGPVGTTVPVIIFGSGFSQFGSNSISVSGYGVTASDVNFISSGVLSANLQITPDASAGNHTVRVTTNGFRSNNLNFFIQVPTVFTPVVLQAANLGCDPNYTGLGGQVRYAVLDQQGQSMNAPGYTPQEHFTSGGNSPFEGFRPFATPPTTDSNGSFLDVPVGTCFEAPPANVCVDVVQTFNIVVGNVTYPIGTITNRRDCVQGIRVTVTNGSVAQSASLGTVN